MWSWCFCPNPSSSGFSEIISWVWLLEAYLSWSCLTPLLSEIHLLISGYQAIFCAVMVPSSSLLYLNQAQWSYFRERRSVDFHQSPSHLHFSWLLHPLLYGPLCPGKAEGLHDPLRTLALQTVDQVIFQAVELEQWFSNSKYIGQLHLFHLWNFLNAQMPGSFIQEVRLQFRNPSV